MANSKGLSWLIWIIIIVIILLLTAGIVLSMQVAAQKLSQKYEQTREQLAIKANIIPKEWYKVMLPQAFSTKGNLYMTVMDTNGTNDTTSDDRYVTDFDPYADYVVKEDGIPATVDNVAAFPVAYIVIIVDPNSPYYDSVIGNASAFKFVNAEFAPIDVTAPNPKTKFTSPEKLAKPTPGTASIADYWGALVIANSILPTVPAEKIVGPNFLGVIVASEGRCDVDCNTNMTKIKAAESFPSDTHFYMLRSDCKPAVGEATTPDSMSEAVLLYAKSNLAPVSEYCYTDTQQLFKDLLENDLAPIRVVYTPKFESPELPVEHNITVTVTKRTGVLGVQSAYSGTGNTIIAY